MAGLTEEEFSKAQKDAFKEDGIFGTPRVPKELVIDLVKQYYGLDVIEIKDLVSFVDQNFRVKVSKEHENPHIPSIWENGYTVKFINTMKSSLKGHFSSVHATLLHLKRKGIRTPTPLANLEGSTFQLVNVPLLNEGEDANPESRKKCGMHILTYIPGVTVASIHNTVDTIYKCGETLAEFQIALEDLDNPILKNKLAFSSLKFFSNMKEFLDDMKDERKTVMYDVIDDFKSELEEKLKDLPKAFIHGDFNDHNILAQAHESETGEQIHVVDGVLDFEEMQWGDVVWDVAILLAHVTQMKKNIPPLEAAGIAFAGYRSLRTISEFELSTLKLCIECRMCMLLWINVFSDKFDPSNAYIASLADPEPKYEVLYQLRKMTNADLLQMFDEIALQRQSGNK